MAKLTKAGRKAVVELLLQLYPDGKCALDFSTNYQLLVAVMLSAQTTDKSVNQVTPELFLRCPDAWTMATMEEEKIQQMIKRIGMYKTKAKNVKAMSALLVELYDGQVPDVYEQLIQLPGVGRKTANVVLSVGFSQQRIAVDTHVFRLANRMGLVQETNVLQTELSLMKNVEEENWTNLHHALIWHGRQVCTARNPQCQRCELTNLCKKNKGKQVKL